MIEFFRHCLTSVTAAAMIVAVIDCMVPNGAIKSITKLAGGLLILLSIVQPILSSEEINKMTFASDIQNNTVEYSMSLDVENDKLINSIIEEETAAYIQNKAKELGFVCSARVNSLYNEQDESISFSVEIAGDLTQDQIDQFSKLIETELGIPVEHQLYERKLIDERIKGHN